MKAFLKYSITLIISIFLVWYLVKHWNELKSLLDISLTKLIFLYVISAVGTLIGGISSMVLIKSLGTKTRFWDMVILQNAIFLLNYAPMKLGTIFRANYLKKHYGLSFARFGTFFMYLTFIMTFTAPATGTVALLAVYSVKKWEIQVLLFSFIASLIISFIFLFIPVPLPKGQNKLSTILRNFLHGRNDVIKNKKTLLYCAALMNINFILTAVRLAIIYYSLGQNVNPAGFLILGAVGYCLMFASITPGAIGIRELVLGAASVAIGVPLKVGIPAAIIDRAISITYSFIIGGICTIYLWRKCPEDFKKD